jgi:hypothetical protein
MRVGVVGVCEEPGAVGALRLRIVRDELGRRAPGIEVIALPAAGAALSPDPLVLAHRVLDPAACAQIVKTLRADGAYPRREALLVHGGSVPDGFFESVRGACGDRLAPVLVGDPTFVEAGRAALEGAFAVPDDAESMLAAASWCAAAVGTSDDVAVVAAALGRPGGVVTDVDALPELLQRAVEPPTEAQLAADAMFDRLAAAALDGQLGPVEQVVALQDFSEGLSREIVSKDPRFTQLWHKIHEADRHYHHHVRRADIAEAKVRQLRVLLWKTRLRRAPIRDILAALGNGVAEAGAVIARKTLYRVRHRSGH